MHRQSCQLTKAASLKRKRRSSENFNNIENQPVPSHHDKKFKDEDTDCDSDHSETGSRLPLSEISVLAATSKDQRCLSAGSTDSELPNVDRLSVSDTSPESPAISPSGLLPKDTSLLSDFGLSPGESESPSPVKPCSSGSKLVSAYGQLTPSDSQVEQSEWNSSRTTSCLPLRDSPFPVLEWADHKELWRLMCSKDESTLSQRDPNMFDHHPSLLPRMRAVLLDWINEVCEVYKLHRETFYLTVDYLDRYLSAREGVPKQQLQLIGITCLLIASKMEEIYPPKVSEYAYVTDGACTESEIHAMELSILKVLHWCLSPFTIHNWLSVYLQLCYQGNERHNLGFVYSQFSPALFSQLCQLVDLATLDINSLKFSYSVIAISAVYLVCSEQLALHVSGFNYSFISDCVDWMRDFWNVLLEENPGGRMDATSTALPPGPNKVSAFDLTHTLQTHSVTLEMLESGQARQEARIREKLSKASPLVVTANLNLLTPPSSSKKA